MSRIKLLLDVVEDMHSLANSLQVLAGAMIQGDEEASREPDIPTAPETTSPPALEPEPTIKLEDLRFRLGEISRAGHTAELHDLIQKYGATHLSKVAPEHYADLLRDAEALTDAT